MKTVTWNKGKTLGQIAYEAMLPLMGERLEKLFPNAPKTPTGDPWLDGAWEAQGQQLRDDWEATAEAVRAAIIETVR
jgi:hypothetical protein